MLQKRYEGFLATPTLWVNSRVYDLEPFEIYTEKSGITMKPNNQLRLGKYVERLVAFELSQHDDITIVGENLQIQDGKVTLGELDILLLKGGQPIHLEVVYKFYLYDESFGSSEIEHFIGPNRKDSLIEKLKKLKEKQMPLLYSKACQSHLNTLHIHLNSITQQVYFKAQLFMPFNNKGIKLKELNNDCIIGFYIHLDELIKLRECKFYIPNKKDWLIIPHTNVKWLSFEKFKPLAIEYVQEKYSPLFWLKYRNGKLEKMFLVWW